MNKKIVKAFSESETHIKIPKDIWLDTVVKQLLADLCTANVEINGRMTLANALVVIQGFRH